MTVRYGLTRLVLGPRQFVDLAAESYEEIRLAQSNLNLTLGLEELYDILLENFSEFEEVLLRLAIREVIFREEHWSPMVSRLHMVNRRLANLLSSCRLYIDHAKHGISQIYGSDSDAFVALNKSFSCEYDAHLEYRVMESLRNVAQHRSLPVHELRHIAGREEEDPARLRSSVTPVLNVERLADEGDFKETVLKELRSGPKRLDLRPLVRQYIESLGRVQEELRAQMREDVRQWSRTLADAVALFAQSYGMQKSVGIAIEAEDGTFAESFHLVPEVDERRAALELKNRCVVSHWFVSNEAREHDLG